MADAPLPGGAGPQAPAASAAARAEAMAGAAAPPHEPAPAAPGAAARPETLVQTLLAIGRELPGLVKDRVELLSLELQRAARALIQVVALVVAVAILGVTAWLVLWGGIVVGLVALGLHLALALFLALAVNAVTALLLVRHLRSLLPLLGLPSTRRHLGFTPESEPEPPEHERTHAAAAARPAHP